MKMRRNFCNRGLTCSIEWILSTCLLLVFSLSLTSIIAVPVDEIGVEVSGIRMSNKDVINECPLLKCKNCPSGFEVDAAGCNTCKCKDPCRDFNCPENEICELTTVQCFVAPCPLIPTCKKISSTI